jgi:hypothetical protein
MDSHIGRRKFLAAVGGAAAASAHGVPAANDAGDGFLGSPSAIAFQSSVKNSVSGRFELSG